MVAPAPARPAQPKRERGATRLAAKARLRLARARAEAGGVSMARIALANLWPAATRTSLPQRVQVRIRANDALSEVLVKLFQLVVFAIWGLAFWLAPRPDPTTESAVPQVIAAYLVVNLVLLVLAWLRNLPDWLVTLSIALDMALLTYLIWTFHIQYEQPASFSLKTVEAFNYFVLIGLRALRFQARYVLIAGALAIVSWSALVIYAVETDPADPMITRDYVTYLTSNSVLVGAEISKLLSFLIFTLVLAVAVRRANGFFVNAITEGTAVRDLTRFMATPVAERIRDAEGLIRAGEGVRRDVAVVFIDIRGFTALAETMAPDDTLALLSAYQHRIVPTVHEHDGIVDKFMGDGIMVTFGAEREGDPDGCARALRFVEAVLRDVETWSDALGRIEVNLAMAYGPVVYGAVGDEDRLELTVIGPTVNTAAKLEKHNRVLGSRAVAEHRAYVRGREQGFRPTLPVVQAEARVEGVRRSLAVWS